MSLDVTARNSKAYYVVLTGGSGREHVTRLPITGNETVLDAVRQAGVVAVTDVWITRPGENGKPDQTLPVDWTAITRHGKTETNYQILPGDRLYVKPK